MSRGITFQPHGTPARYDNGTLEGEPPCREACCREAAAAAKRRRRRLAAYGRPATTDPAPVLAHVQWLLAAGMSRAQIAAAAGVSGEAVKRLPGQIRIRTGNAQKLLAVRPPTADTVTDLGSFICAVGTARRIQACVAAGWTVSAVAEEAGLGRHVVNALCLGRRRTCRGFTAVAVRAATSRLWERRPPRHTLAERRMYGRSLTLAARRGWVPFVAWDDDIDDPAAVPKGVPKTRDAA